MTFRPVFLLFILSLVTIVGVLILLVTDHTVPAEFWTLTVTAFGATAGAAVPTASTRKEVN